MKKNHLQEKYSKEHSFIEKERVIFSRLWFYLKPYKLSIFLALFFLVCAKAIEAFIPLYVGYLVQNIINGSIQFDTVFTTSLYLLSLIFLGYLLDTMSLILKNWTGSKALYKLRADVFNHIQHLPLSDYDQNPMGRFITRTIHDVDQISQMFTESIIPILGSLVLFISICSALFYLDIQIAMVFFALVPIVLYQTNRFRKNQRQGYSVVRNIVTAMNIFVQEHLMGASIIRNFSLEKKERQQFNEINQDHCEASKRVIEHFAFFMSTIDLLQNIALISGFLVLVLVTPPHLSFQAGIFFTFSLYTIMFFRPLADLAERYNILQSAVSAAERIFHIMDQKTEPKEGKKREKLEEVVSIRFENVWFAYEPNHWIFKGLNFEIKKGESLAILGTTGSGKTTIISLLLRFYDIQMGAIKVNGKDIREYPLHTLRRLFGVVLQDPVIFSGSIFDNIVLYDKEITPKMVHETVNFLELQYLINQFPNGLMAKLTERGQSLSSGEMQLISLARALCHDRGVLILDEATANIDSFTERIIQKALKKIFEEKTAIVIAHRLSTIKDVSRIMVIHDGVVIESGTHAQLLRKKGLYEKLHRVQFQS